MSLPSSQLGHAAPTLYDATVPWSLTSIDGSNLIRNDDEDSETSSRRDDNGSGCGDGTGEPSTSNSSRGDQQLLVPKQEANAVRRTKALVYSVLILAAAGIGLLIYLLTSYENWHACQQSFHEISISLALNGESNVAAIFNHVQTIATSVTSVATSSNMTFPNVTLPNMDARGREAKDLSGIQMTIYAPIVKKASAGAWEAFASTQNWVESDLSYYPAADRIHSGSVSPTIFEFTSSMEHEHHGHDEREAGELSVSTEEDPDGHALTEGGGNTVAEEDFAVPLSQLGPVPQNVSVINVDLMTYPPLHDAITETLHVERKHLSGIMDLDFLLHSQGEYNDGTPRSVAVVPVRDGFVEGSEIVGFVFGVIKWAKFFTDVLPPATKPIIAVVEDPCGSTAAFRIEGERAEFLGGNGTTSTGRLQQVFEFAEFVREHGGKEGTVQVSGHASCEVTLRLYSTVEFDQACDTAGPALYTTAVVLVFFVAVITFALYDFWVLRRQQNLLSKAQRTDAIVTSLFPKQVQRRVLEDAGAHNAAPNKTKWKGILPKGENSPEFLGDDNARAALQGHADRPIADLYSEATIMFADIVGFTEWSSCRVPSDVFTLLETIFSGFDQVAARRRVFKVETVGDCYVASCGVPEPRKDHALIMARFARDCLVSFNDGVKRLEQTLGPDTGALGIRIGIHSGPVTAGVLRGERSRFQLFGDTMNTCSRIESTGCRNRIHVSQETAELLKAHGKGHWCRKRDDSVTAKGKGSLETYWLEVKDGSAMSSHSSESGTDADVHRSGVKTSDDRRDAASSSFLVNGDRSDGANDQTIRLVKWNADILAKFLTEVVAKRERANAPSAPVESIRKVERDLLHSEGSPLDEVKEAIRLPKWRLGAPAPLEAELAEPVLEQLHSYLLSIALMYRNNSFHCFEHATHVTMSVVKLLSRITVVDPDPLTRFAVVLSALIHDVDHRGVPNAQLEREGDVTAAAYNNQSPAEQNSIDIAWALLMRDEHRDLRAAIYATPDQLHQFRQVVVNTVMATDIMDKELGMARKRRWVLAFGGDGEAADEASRTDSADEDRKATVVLEHLIQASDVAHTMQHWNVYRKWNTRYFEECHRAFLDGRADANPADDWYEGELGFFDHYIIPLARKLKDCGVFGVSSDEYLVYAQRNRREWENRGREEVEAMVQAVCRLSI